MSACTLWQASRRVGELLRDSSDAAALREAVDIDGTRGPADPHVTIVRHILAGFNPLRTRPLLLGLYLPRIPSMGPIPGYDELGRIDGGAEFLDSTARVSSTMLSIVEYLRVRVPRYPSIPVPDLGAGSPAVVNDGFLAFDRLPWPAAARARRPPDEHSELDTGSVLDIDITALQESVDEVREALEQQEAWREFARVSAEIGDTDLEQLRRICAEFDELTTEAVVDERAGDLLMQRGQYARAVLEEAHSRASDRAGEYLAGFRRVDHLINLAAAVISERVAHDTPIGLPAEAEVSWHRIGGTVEVRALIPADPLPFLHPGRLVVYQADPPVGGAWFLSGTSHTINFELGSQSTLTGEGLEDSAGVFDDLVRPESDRATTSTERPRAGPPQGQS